MKEAESELEDSKLHLVSLKSQIEWIFFQPMRYGGDGDSCVVKGPVLIPRQVQAEKIFQVVASEVVPVLGTPIICHGLHSSNNLNGKIGDLRSWDEDCDIWSTKLQQTISYLMMISLSHHEMRKYYVLNLLL